MATAPITMDKDHTQACVVSLLFTPNRLPHPSEVVALAERDGGFSISQDLRSGDVPEAAGATLELLSAGVTCDLFWPDAESVITIPDCTDAFDLPPDFNGRGTAPLHLFAGHHIAGNEAMMPIAQQLAELAARLCGLAGVEAILWHPAGTWIGPDYFRSIAENWSNGGVFPSRGLVRLEMVADGAIQSRGIAFFTGQELRIERELLDDPTIADKIAFRLIDQLIGAGMLEETRELAGPDGRPLRMTPSSNGRLVRIWGGG